MNYFRPVKKIARYLPITKLDSKSTTKLRKQLSGIKKDKNLTCLVAGVNIQKGPIVQSEIVGSLLKTKAKELGVPLITFAEEAAFSTGLHLLMYGDIILSNPCSMIGNVGFTSNPLQLKQFT